MKPWFRYVVWAPLLLIALEIAFALGESLRGEPCLDERAGWVARNVIFAVFALYFFLGYWLLVTQKYLVVAILTIWAGHLLVISPLLTTSCSEGRTRDRIGDMVGFGFWEFVAAVALVAIATSIALYLRYRPMVGTPIRAQRTFLRVAVAGVTIAVFLLAAVANWIAPLLKGAVGADLPAPTLALLSYSQYWLVLPLICVAALLYVNLIREYTGAQMVVLLRSGVGLIVLVNALSSFLLFSVFGSALTMCGCV